MGFKRELKCIKKCKLDNRVQPAKEMAKDEDAAEEEAQAAAMEETNELNKLATRRVISLKSSKKTKTQNSLKPKKLTAQRPTPIPSIVRLQTLLEAHPINKTWKIQLQMPLLMRSTSVEKLKCKPL